jgi:hypothetical protein
MVIRRQLAHGDPHAIEVMDSAIGGTLEAHVSYTSNTMRGRRR